MDEKGKDKKEGSPPFTQKRIVQAAANDAVQVKVAQGKILYKLEARAPKNGNFANDLCVKLYIPNERPIKTAT